MKASPLRFEGFVARSGRRFESICPDLDVASFGKTALEARRSLVEACQLYIESAIDNNLPYLRPMPAGERPLRQAPEDVVDRFMVTIEVAVKARA